MIFPSIKNYIEEAVKAFDQIPAPRKSVLEQASAFIAEKVKFDAPVALIYICTHNSRRSHFGQIWGKVAAHYYGYKKVQTFSGGTEATAFNANAIKAVKSVGFEVKETGLAVNPHYKVYYNDEHAEIECFSKKYDDLANPQEGFIAVMTCTSADEGCPVVRGAALRVSTPYEDPKKFDGTAFQDAKYSERCLQIATETLYLFSQVKSFLHKS